MAQKQLHVALGILCCKKSESVRVLITQRPHDTVLGGSWEFPGGKIEANESPRQAVSRELLEEIGIEVEPITALSVIEHVYEHAHVYLHPWLCKQLNGEPQNLEVIAHRWVGLEELLQIEFPSANNALVAELQCYDFKAIFKIK